MPQILEITPALASLFLQPRRDSINASKTPRTSGWYFWASTPTGQNNLADHLTEGSGCQGSENATERAVFFLPEP